MDTWANKLYSLDIILHLQPENLLLGNNGNLILTDFGWSTDFDSDAEGRMTVCGTPGTNRNCYYIITASAIAPATL
jgi:hypothetical protein